MVWAFYRDVRSVDGEAVRDRSARLEALFPEGQTPAANARALQILDESSRYNLGQRRTVNSPTLALTLLHPRNRKRSSFEASGGGRKEGVPACKLLYEERKRPTLISNPDGEDVPARGAFWIEPGSGAVVASSLELKTPGHDPVLIETSFRHEAALACWLPAEMKETYGGRAPRPRERAPRGRGPLFRVAPRPRRDRRHHPEVATAAAMLDCRAHDLEGRDPRSARASRLRHLRFAAARGLGAQRPGDHLGDPADRHGPRRRAAARGRGARRGHRGLQLRLRGAQPRRLAPALRHARGAAHLARARRRACASSGRSAPRRWRAACRSSPGPSTRCARRTRG